MPEQEETTLPLLANPRNSDVRLVETANQLDAAAATLKSLQGPIAVDAERASGFKYYANAYLVQIYRANGPIYLIDPPAVLATDPAAFNRLQNAITGAEWVLHAATQDLPCLRELGLEPGSIFDTELAARLLGLERVGLGATCELLLKFRLAKEHSAVDWSTRPLKEEWLNYAALDVDVLLDLRQAMTKELEVANKTQLASQEFEHLLSFKPKPTDPEKWRSMSGLHTVKSQRALAVARALWFAREQLAQKIDVSPSRLIPDSSIVTICTESPTNRAALAANRKFVGRASRSYLDTWWEAVQQGQKEHQLPPLKPEPLAIPNHRFWANRFPESDARLKAAKARLSEIAQEMQLPLENLLTPETLRVICWDTGLFEQSAIEKQLVESRARRWQIEAVSEALSLCLSSLPDLQNEG